MIVTLNQFYLTGPSSLEILWMSGVSVACCHYYDIMEFLWQDALAFPSKIMLLQNWECFFWQAVHYAECYWISIENRGIDYSIPKMKAATTEKYPWSHS